MNRIYAMLCLWVLAAGGCVSAERPNILFILSDDQRHDTIHALGNAEISTPNIDKLVDNGCAFTRAYIMGGTQGAVCVPSRAMLMTGRTMFHVGDHIEKEYACWPALFGKAGYATFGTGKWHNGAPSFARCFESGANIFFGGMTDHLKVPLQPFDAAGRYPKSAQYIGAKFDAEIYADSAIKFLEGHKSDKPFCLYLSFTSPHDPRMAPPDFAKLFTPADLPVPKNFLPQHPFDNGEMAIRDEKLAPFPRTPEVVREHLAAYYAMVSHMDAQIGRVLETLEKTGLAKNTIVVFAGDNGLAVGQHGLFGKQSVYDHSVHVPLVFCGPGIPKGKRSDALCYLIDIFPTLCEMTGVTVPETVEGKSLLPVLKGEKDAHRESLFFAYRNLHRGVRDARYKLIEYFVKGARHTQLFDLAVDPIEMKNIAEDAAQAGTLKRLRGELADWQKKLDDPINKTGGK